MFLQTGRQNGLGSAYTSTGANHAALFGAMGGMQGFNPDDVVKALATTGSAGANGSALIGYDLDKMIRVLTLSPETNTPKLQRWYTYEAKAFLREFNVMQSRGRAKGSARREGHLGVVDSAKYTRKSTEIKSIGRTAAVTFELQAAAERSFGDAKSMEVANQLARMLMDTERDIWHGDDELNPLIWKGIFQQMDPGAQFKTDLSTRGIAGSRETIIGGGDLTLAKVRRQTPKIIKEGGIYTALYCSPETQEQLGSQQDAGSRWFKEAQNSRFVLGMKVDQITQSNNNPLDIIYDVWLSGIRGELLPEPNDPSNSDEFHSEQPAQLGTAPTGAVAAGGYLPVDEYFYAVCAKNEVGEGPVAIQSTGYTTTNTDGKVNITVTHPGDTSKIKSYVLFRSTTGGSYSNFRRVKEVAINTASATQVIEDDGSIVPGSREAVMINETMADLGSLANPQAVELPLVDLTHRVALFAMLDVALKAPRHIHRWYNEAGTVADPE